MRRHAQPSPRLAILTLARGSVQTVPPEPSAESSSTQVGDVIDSTKMTNLPLSGRSHLDLPGLQAGVVPISSSTQSQASCTLSLPLPARLSEGGHYVYAAPFGLRNSLLPC
jgi:hypothetical protein